VILVQKPRAGDNRGLGRIPLDEIGDVSDQRFYWKPYPGLQPRVKRSMLRLESAFPTTVDGHRSGGSRG